MRYKPYEMPEGERFSEADRKELAGHCEAVKSYALNFHLLDEDQEKEMLCAALDIAVLVRKYVK